MDRYFRDINSSFAHACTSMRVARNNFASRLGGRLPALSGELCTIHTYMYVRVILCNLPHSELVQLVRKRPS